MTVQDDTRIAHDSDLLAYVDGQLDPEKMAEIEARLARDPEAREAAAQWRHMNNLLYDHARSADDLPANLRIAALERELAAKLTRQRWRSMLFGDGLRRVAAGMVLFVAGWGSHALYTSGMTGFTPAAYPYYATTALAGHASYMLAAHEAASFAPDDMAAATEWMSEKMQRKIDSPKLDRLGYRVESARLMTIEDRPVAVFYYRNPDDQRVTVSIAPRTVERAPNPLQVVSIDDRVMAYWSSGDLHYTIVANESRGAITTLAAAVQE